MSAPENPPAFPEVPGDGNAYEGRSGMSLRDWCASQADVSVYKPVASFEADEGRLPTVAELAEYIAQIRFIEADAMLAERAKGGIS